MSVIKIIIGPSDSVIDAVKSLHNIVSGSVGELKDAIKKNKTPIFEEEIFTNSYEEHAAVLRKILDQIETQELEHFIFEGEHEINSSKLVNLLTASDEIGIEAENEYSN